MTHEQEILAGELNILLRASFPHSELHSPWVKNFNRSSIDKRMGFPRQGWKLHVSASVCSYDEILRSVCPLIDRFNIPAKAIKSIGELQKLNAGIFYGLSQIGKAITIYCRNAKEAKIMAQAIHKATRHCVAPIVPCEARIRPGSCVYFRYGAFVGDKILAPNGKYIDDDRTSAPPNWALPDSPFKYRFFSHFNLKKFPGAIGQRYLPADLISARGKGCVYLALDIECPSRFVIVKSGFRYGEINGNGIDGQARLRLEARWLRKALSLAVPVPRVLDYYHGRNTSFVVFERPSGTSLAEILAVQTEKKPDLQTKIKIALKVIHSLSLLHADEIVWGDLKPTNLLVDEDEFQQIQVWILDVEGAGIVGQSNSYWGSPHYSAPETRSTRYCLDTAADIYAFGVLLAQISTWLPKPDMAKRRLKRRKGSLDTLARICTVEEPSGRPSAKQLLEALTEIQADTQSHQATNQSRHRGLVS